MSRTEKKHPDMVCPNGRKHCACGMFWWNVKKRAVYHAEVKEAEQEILEHTAPRAKGQCGVCGELNDPACRLGC